MACKVTIPRNADPGGIIWLKPSESEALSTSAGDAGGQLALDLVIAGIFILLISRAMRHCCWRLRWKSLCVLAADGAHPVQKEVEVSSLCGCCSRLLDGPGGAARRLACPQCRRPCQARRCALYSYSIALCLHHAWPSLQF